MALETLETPLFTAAQFIAAMLLFCWHQPRRADFARRMAASIAAYIFATILFTWVGFSSRPELMTTFALPTQIATFVLVFFVWAAIIFFCFDVSRSHAAFLGVALYSAQNLADGLIGLIEVMLGELRNNQPVPVDGFVASPSAMTLEGVIISAVVTVIVYLLMWFFFARRLTGAWISSSHDRKILLMFFAVIFFEITFDLTVKEVFAVGLPLFHRLVFILTKVLLCIFVLFAEFEILLNGRLEASYSTAERLMKERQRQYELSRENIDQINMKAHDIRHQIRTLKGAAHIDSDVLDDIAREVSIYDSTVQTGNDAIDTILTEKSLTCDQEGITLSCIVDGASLSFMSAADLYALFGNALENAIEAAVGIEDPERRSISLTVKERAGMVSIHVENYFSGEVTFENGMPRSSKGDLLNHGIGTKSMRHIAERYGGTLTARAKNGVYYLNILIPVPE